MKKLFALLLVLVLGVSLVACGGGDDPYGIVDGGDSSVQPEGGSAAAEVDTEALWQSIEGLWLNDASGHYVRFYRQGTQLRMEAGIVDGVAGDNIAANGRLTGAAQNDHEYTLTFAFDATADVAAYSYNVYLSDLSLGSGKLMVSDMVQQGAVTTYVYSEKTVSELEAEQDASDASFTAFWDSVQGVWLLHVAEEDCFYFVMNVYDAFTGEPAFTAGIPFSGAMMGGAVTAAENSEGGKWQLTVHVPEAAPSEMDDGHAAMDFTVNMELSETLNNTLWCDNVMGDGSYCAFYYVGDSLDDITFDLLGAFTAGN